MIFTHTMSVRFRHPVPVGLLVSCLKLTKNLLFTIFICKFAQKFFDKSDKYHNKLITLLCCDSVTNVMAAWIDSKIMERWQSGRLRQS